MEFAIQQERQIKYLNREKLGEGVLFAFDETNRALVVCAPTKVSHQQCHRPRRADLNCDQLQLHLFIFDESYKTLQSQGNATNLAPWYGHTGTSILHIAFVCGNEEVVLVDSSAKARIFSFVTLQFRYHSLLLGTSGRALLTVHSEGLLLYNSHLFPPLYSRLQMVPAFLFFTLATRSHFSLRIIGNHLEKMQEFA